MSDSDPNKRGKTEIRSRLMRAFDLRDDDRSPRSYSADDGHLGPELGTAEMGGLSALRPGLPASFGLALAIGVLFLTGWLLAVGRDLLIPIAIAFMIWFLLNALARFFRRMHWGGHHLPAVAAMTLSIIAVLVVLVFLVNMVANNISAVTQVLPTYEDNLDKLTAQASSWIGKDLTASFDKMIADIPVAQLLTRIAGTLANVASQFGIVLVYVLFLLVEQQAFDSKIHALFPDPRRESRVRAVLSDIQREIQTYIWIKTLMSVLTGGISYVVLIAVGVSFAEFWAVFIFLLNYIPTIGSLLGILFPAALTLMQFGAFIPFLLVLVPLAVAQIIIGNVIEPRLMGSSLNISALVVILSLTLWGAIWGITGMFLSVPIMVVLMIVLGHFPVTRPIAILMSADGRIRDADSER